MSGASRAHRSVEPMGPLKAVVSADMASAQRDCISTSTIASMTRGSSAYATVHRARTAAEARRARLMSTA